MNEYAIFSTVELMIVVDAENEHEARVKAAKARFDEWDCFPRDGSLHVELRGPSDDAESLELERQYREKELDAR